MKFIKTVFISLTAALFALSCSQTQPTDTTVVNTTNKAVVVANSSPQPSATLDELAAARKHYSELCVKCHKEGGLGGVSEIDGKRIKSPNFTSERMMKDDDADWIEALENGIPDDGMPAFKDKLSEQEIKDLVKLIRKDFQKK
jgi:mono/diheme cytochrome c family protein